MGSPCVCVCVCVFVYVYIILCNSALCCRDYLALNVYIAQCYFKLNYYDMSQVTGLMVFIH